VRPKVLIDLDVDLLPILKGCGADERILASIRAPSPIRKVIPAGAGQKPSERGDVETVNGGPESLRRKFIGSRHLLEEF
jgi:hypothetical protein